MVLQYIVQPTDKEEIQVLQGSILGPLPFLLYINDLNQVLKFCKVHQFANDTNLLCMSNSE